MSKKPGRVRGKKPVKAAGETLSEHDRAAWEAVTKSVTPLGGRPETPPPPKAPRATIVRNDGLPQEWYIGTAPAPTARVDRKTRRNISKGRQEFDRSVDLHGLTQDHAFNTLKSVIEGCIRRGDKTLLVVTGKGGARFSQTAAAPVAYRTRNEFDQFGGVLKRMAPLWLAGPELKPFVHSYGPASRDHGGDGALYVLLRRHAPGTKGR